MACDFFSWNLESLAWVLLFVGVLAISFWFSKFVLLVNAFIVWFFGFLGKGAKRVPAVFSPFLESLKIRKVSSKTIILTIALVLVFELTYNILFKGVGVSLVKGNPLVVVFLVPVIEEFVYRGLIFGVLLLIVDSLKNQLFKNIALGLALSLQTVIFALSHEALTLNVLLGGFLFGLLFLYSKKNLLPGILAHAIHNLIIIMTFCF